MTEIWKPIPTHYPYEASSLGQIRNGLKGNILVPVIWGKRGHLGVKVGGGRGASKKYIHRLVLTAFIGLPAEGQIGCHLNDVKTDNRIENLYWGDYKQNYQDALRNGKYTDEQMLNFRASTRKYDEEIIQKIIAEYTGKRGEQSALARKYNMSISNVHLIVHGLTRVK